MIRRVPIHRLDAAGLHAPTSDDVAIEEPLLIRMGFVRGRRRVTQTVSVTMRSPGNDDELAVQAMTRIALQHLQGWPTTVTAETAAQCAHQRRLALEMGAKN